MQIPKRIKNKKIGQNLIEFIFIIIIVLPLTLIIFEAALYWQDVNAISDLNAEINANVALNNPQSLELNKECPAAKIALETLTKRDNMISLSDVEYDTVISQGTTEPFVLYSFVSKNLIYYPDPKQQVTVHSKSTPTLISRPQVTLWVDCRNPFEQGISTQLEFYHKTLIMSAQIPNFSGKNLTLIPKHFFISSPKLNTLRNY